MTGVRAIVVLAVVILLAACSGDEADISTAGTGGGANCNGYCATDPAIADDDKRLLVSDVEKIIAQAVAEATARGANATIAVVDRVGNVLAVYRMAPQSILIATRPDGQQKSLVNGGLEGIYLPNTNINLAIDDQAAIAKAITGAYFSSEGNALSTRTASQVIQQHFNPGELFQPAGPLFGVQFSQLACSDFNFKDATRTEGPKKSPLGFAADPGGLPLYKSGTVVGSVGVIADGIYSLDANISDNERNLDELIATAATYGYAAPIGLRADRFAIDGKLLIFSNVTFADLLTRAANVPVFGSPEVPAANLAVVNGYTDGTIKQGVVFAQAQSGIRQASFMTGPFEGVEDAFIFVDATGVDPQDSLTGINRFPPIAGTNAGTALTELETRTILREALKVANRSRRQVGRPLNGPARVNITMVDADGEIIGMVRSRDAIVDGADVTVQKARTAAFFSSANAASFIQALPDAQYLSTNDDSSGVPLQSSTIATYIPQAQDFFGMTDIFTNSDYAFSERAIGLVSMPLYPDGVDGTPPGPFSKPAGEWSIFNIGLQLDVSYNALLQHVLYTAVTSTPGAFPVLALPDVGIGCTGVDLAADLSTVSNSVTGKQLANGLQSFAGSLPIYKGNDLVGAIGVSGDGNDQADMISLLGIYNAGKLLGTVNNAPFDKRVDRLLPQGVRLRYAQCPISPFIGSDVQNVCAGK